MLRSAVAAAFFAIVLVDGSVVKLSINPELTTAAAEVKERGLQPKEILTAKPSDFPAQGPWLYDDGKIVTDTKWVRLKRFLRSYWQ